MKLVLIHISLIIHQLTRGADKDAPQYLREP